MGVYYVIVEKDAQKQERVVLSAQTRSEARRRLKEYNDRLLQIYGENNPEKPYTYIKTMPTI